MNVILRMLSGNVFKRPHESEIRKLIDGNRFSCLPASSFKCRYLGAEPNMADCFGYIPSCANIHSTSYNVVFH